MNQLSENADLGDDPKPKARRIADGGKPSARKPWSTPTLARLSVRDTAGGRFTINFETTVWFNDCVNNPSLCS